MLVRTLDIEQKGSQISVNNDPKEIRVFSQIKFSDI